MKANKIKVVTKEQKELKKIIDSINATVEKSIEEDLVNERVYLLAKTVLKKYDGKALGKNFLKDLKEVMPDAYLNNLGNRLRIIVPNPSMSITLSHGETFNYSDLDRKNTCYLEEHHERIKKNKKFLKNKKLVEKFALNILKMKQAHAFFSDEVDSFETPSYYSIMRLSGLEIKKIRD